MAAAEAMQDVRRFSIQGDLTHRLLPADHPQDLTVHWSIHPLQSPSHRHHMAAYSAACQSLLLPSRVRHACLRFGSQSSKHWCADASYNRTFTRVLILVI